MNFVIFYLLSILVKVKQTVQQNLKKISFFRLIVFVFVNNAFEDLLVGKSQMKIDPFNPCPAE